MTKDQGLYSKPSAAVHPGALAAGTIPKYDTIKRRKADWIDHVLRSNCILKHTSEGNIEKTGERGRRRKRLPDHFKETVW